MPSKTFTLGVLVLPPVQLLDLSPTDLFGMLTRTYLEACDLPAPLLALGIDVEIHYITSSHADESRTTPNTNPDGGDVGKPGGAGNAVPLTANMHILSTTNINDPKVQPGLLSALLIPGPEPKYIPTAAEIAFMQSHANSGTDILTVCTGVFAAGHAGILDGRKVTGPRGLVGKLRGMFPKATWGERRWETDTLGGEAGGGGHQKRGESECEGKAKTNINGDHYSSPHVDTRTSTSTANANTGSKGQLWTSSGITNGLDMVAAYLHHKARFTPKSTSTSTSTTTPSNPNPSLKVNSSSSSSQTAQTPPTNKTPPNPATQTQLPSPELIDLICRLADIPQRSQDYDVSKVREVGWWMWLIGRSWVRGLMRRA